MSIGSLMPSNHLVLCCPFLLLPSVFPRSGSFLMSWLFASGSQSSGVSISASVLSMDIQGWFPLGLTGLISLQSKGHSSKALILWLSLLYGPTLTSIHDYWKTIALTRWTFLGKVMSLPFNLLSRLVIAFLPRSKHLLISWLQSPSAVILEPKKIKSVIVSPSICHEVMGPNVIILVFWMLSFNPGFSLSSLTFIKTLFSSSSLSAIRMVLSAYLFSSVAQSCTTLCKPMDCTMPGLPVHQPTLGAHSNSCPSSWWCHPTISSSVIPFSFCLSSIFPSIRVFSNESALRIRWPKYWSFSLNISPSN